MGYVLENLERARERIKNKRIELHLRKTEEDLEERTATGPEADRRREMLEELSNYRERGQFPTNIRHGERTPLFVGDKGNLCAVGFLMQQDGRENLIENIQNTKNEIRLENVGPESDVSEWIHGSRLTEDEAARIQPSYPHMVTLASNCGPVSCKTLLLLLSLASSALLLKLEEIAWKHSKSLYPDKPLKRGGFLAGASALNISTAATLVFLAYVLIP